jgi:hypothetical protein
MAVARIVIDGDVGSRVDLSTGVAVALSNQNDAGVIKWEWELVSRPVGSSSVFADSSAVTSSIPAPSFTPDQKGTYLIRLVVNDTLIPDEPSARNIIDILGADQKGGAVLTTQGYRKPASGETIEFSTAHGWALPINEVIDGLDTAELDILGKADSVHDHVEADITDLDKYTQAQVDALLSAVPFAVEWGEDLATAPAAAEAYSNSDAIHRVRKFNHTDTAGLAFTWFVPSTLPAAATIKFRVKAIVTEAAAPSNESIRFTCAGFCAVDGGASSAALGSAQTSAATGRSDPQHDWIVTAWSSGITIPGLAAGGVATLHVYRDQTVDSNYGQAVGVVLVEIAIA